MATGQPKGKTDESTAGELNARRRQLFTLRLKSAAAASKAAQAPAIPLADRNSPLPLSSAQQRLWFLDQLDRAAGAAYNIMSGLRLKGVLDEAALQATLDRLLERHESLRTSFVLGAKGPIQIIGPAKAGLALARDDLGALSADEQALAVMRVGADECKREFDLATGPLVRGRLLRLGPTEHILLLTVHHIVTDGWSTRVLVQEFGTLYTAFCGGKTDPLPPPVIQYADYALWQRNWLEGNMLEAQLSFWKQQLADAPALLELPTDRPRPAVQSYAGSQLALHFQPGLIASLRELGLRNGTTLFMTMLAGWAVLLSRLSGQRDLVIGTPVANRRLAETESLIGFFVNTLALRICLDDGLSVEQLLVQIKSTTLAAYSHQDLPFEHVVEAVRPTRSMSHSPIFQVMLAMNNVPEHGELTLPGLVLSELGVVPATIHFDLQLNLVEANGSVVGALAYASDLFDAATIERWARWFENLLEAMVDDAGASVLRLPMLDRTEQTLLARFNDTAHAEPAAQLIGSAFEAQALAQPDALAVVYEEHHLSYAHLNRRANLLAHRLLDQGVAPDDCIALSVERGVEALVGILGIWKAGAACVPMDPHSPPERLAHMLTDCTPVAILTHSKVRALLPAPPSVPVLALDDPSLQEGEADNPDPVACGLTGRHLAYVIYTSGSTGTPKGVMVEHRSALNFWSAMCATTHKGYQPGARIALNASFAFDMSLKAILQLLSGHCVHIVPQETRLDGKRFLAFLAQHRIDAFDCTPSQLEPLLAAGLLDGGAWQSGRVLIGGEAINAATWDRLRRSRTVTFFNMYGPTECTVDATIGDIAADDARAHIGRPIGNAHVHILDPLGQAVPVGVFGEIHIGGQGVARGYLKQAALTAERFVTHVAADGSRLRLYRTGDIGRWLQDGRIEYRGRNDSQVKIRGFRIELGEIEAKLGECVGVEEAVAIVREDRPNEKRLIAYYVGEAQAETLRATLTEKLPHYMVPNALVPLESIPLTSNGKLNRAALPQIDADNYTQREYEPPEGFIEEILASSWIELLGLKKAGRNDDFFAIGGHSLATVQVVQKIVSATGIEISPALIFKSPRLRDLAREIQALINVSDTATSAVQVRPGDQQALFFFPIVNGDYSYAALLAPEIASNRPISAVPWPSPFAPLPPTMEVMAEEVAATLMKAQPDGPYALFGYSSGGILAYAVAQHLLAQGKEVELVGLLDTSFYTIPRKTAQQMLLEALSVNDVKPTVKADVLPWNEFIEALKNDCLLDSTFNVSLSKNIWDQRANFYKLLNNYIPPPSDVRTGLFYSAGDPVVEGRLSPLVQPWLHVVDKNALVAISTPGDHYNMLNPDNRVVLGKKMSALIAGTNH